MKFYDFHLYFVPTKAWLEEFGFEGACVINKEFDQEGLIKGEEIKAKGKQEIQEKVKKSEADFIILEKAPDRIVQYAIQEGIVNCVTDLEKGRSGVPLHYRNSGMNQVMAKAASENEVIIDFNFNTILSSKGEKRALMLSRMRQNIELCKKYNAPIILSSGALSKFQMVPAYDLVGFGQVLGLTKGEAKKALNSSQKKILKELG